MNDSLQQVHSWKWSHTTGGRAFFSKACTTLLKPEADRPVTAAAQLQKRMKSRREYPFACMDSQMVGSEWSIASSSPGGQRVRGTRTSFERLTGSPGLEVDGPVRQDRKADRHQIWLGIARHKTPLCDIHHKRV